MLNTNVGKDDLTNSDQKGSPIEEVRLSDESISIDRKGLSPSNDDDGSIDKNSHSSLGDSPEIKTNISPSSPDIDLDQVDQSYSVASADTDPYLSAMDTKKIPVTETASEDAKEPWLRRNLRFSTKHFWKKAGVAVLSVMSLVHIAGKVSKQAKLPETRALAAATYTPNSGNVLEDRYKWAENSKRYAGTTQEVAGMSWYSYTGNLTDALQSGQYTSLQEAHESVEQSGVTGLLHYSPQIPVSSKGTDQGWKIGEAADRRVVLVQGEGASGGVILNSLVAADDQTFSRDIMRMTHTVRTLFDVPDEHITVLKSPTRAEVEETLQRIGEESTEDTEVLFYYVGHALSISSSIATGQGSHRGTLSMSETSGLLSEQELMDVSVNHLSGVKSFSIVLDACYTGSFIY